MDRENQMDNPCATWLGDTAWDNITELDKLTNFHGIITSFEQYPRDWNIWYTSSEPETSPLPSKSCHPTYQPFVATKQNISIFPAPLREI